jgi:uncharacterized protein (TIGR02271 family)
MGQPSPVEQAIVLDSAGVRGLIEAKTMPTGAGAAVWVTFDRDQRVQVPVELLRRRDDGVYSLPVSLRDLQSGVASLGPRPDPLLGPREVTVVPIVEEQVEVGKRTVTAGRVHVAKEVHEVQAAVDLPLVQEHVQVERVPVERYLAEPVAPHYEGDTLVIPVMEEVLVVEKRLLLREEVRVTTVRQATPHRETVTLRKEQVAITREEPASEAPSVQDVRAAEAESSTARPASP